MSLNMIADDFILRRNNLLKLIRNPKAGVLIYGRNVLKRIPTVQYNFNQFSDIVYLTGYTRPDGALTIDIRDGKPYSTLYLPPRIPHEEMWEGKRTSFEDAQKLSGVDRVLPMCELEGWIARKSSDPQNVFQSSPPLQRVFNSKFQSLAKYMDVLRVLKSPKEIEIIKKACEISKIAHQISLHQVAPGIRESQIASRFYLECIERGASGLSYPTVCASGTNALCLHYIENNKIMKEGECLMMDAGCEYENYSSDFTNTVPVGKVPTAHLDLLEMVNDVKDFLVRKVKKGQIHSLGQLHNESEELLIRGLKQFGVKMDKRTIGKYYPHGASHWIGMDVHDCDTIGYGFPIQKGCVFSVEPGLYFPFGSPEIPTELHGLGCRFEDTVIIE
ncbi:putative Xaa-Pro aminopeptidase 3 [Tritrichomonas foetus]|uniref:Xaa-Pro aminopeptidase 3 n=1 Tax=Tritrichomonas foetus TaxID=1144522 RepID=A0A1J4KVN1_9EUKA|nr:putative Xaa-Pro aminopeptidase 3 [Tritrichomonas foetus]|eukprot:OHT15369.1 putative Xaa-Pro aminopeptidase 3 [Tritrichomonas foetus]